MTAAPLVLGNLDCEARWSHAALPHRVLTRVSAAATLLRFLFDEPIVLWTPAPVDPRRLRDMEGAAAPQLVEGPMPRSARAAWAAFEGAVQDGRLRDRFGVGRPAPLAIARAVNDRRFAAALAEELAVAPAGCCELRSIDELVAHLAAGGADESPTGGWICKVPLSAAGRDRVIGAGAVTAEQRRALERLLARSKVVLFEPWLSRIADLGVCGVVRDDAVEQRPPHALVTSERGGFLGIAAAAVSTLEQRAVLERVVAAVGDALRAAGYRGPFAVDAFLHRARDGSAKLRPLCEINARLSFGWIFAALAERFGARELGFSAAPPPGATALVDAAQGDVAAWIR